ERPLLLVLEDLHWGDALTVKLCGIALKKLRGCPLMVLALARPEVDELFPDLWASKAHVIPLIPLSKKAGERLVRQVVGSRGGPGWRREDRGPGRGQRALPGRADPRRRRGQGRRGVGDGAGHDAGAHGALAGGLTPGAPGGERVRRDRRARRPPGAARWLDV